MNKMMRSFRSNYVEDALLVTLVIVIVLGLFWLPCTSDPELATTLQQPLLPFAGNEPHVISEG